jgi:hypothetical protein
MFRRQTKIPIKNLIGNINICPTRLNMKSLWRMLPVSYSVFLIKKQKYFCIFE